MSPRLFTPTQFQARVDNVYLTARQNVLIDGRASEVVGLIDSKGKEHWVLNTGEDSFARRPDDVHALIRQHHATAAIHVAECWLGWLSGDREVDSIAPTDRPDREEILIVCGVWPLMKMSEVRCASIVRPSEDTVDLVELDLAGALEAAGLPLDGKVTAASWLSGLLPRH